METEVYLAFRSNKVSYLQGRMHFRESYMSIAREEMIACDRRIIDASNDQHLPARVIGSQDSQHPYHINMSISSYYPVYRLSLP